MQQRRHFKQTQSLQERLSDEAQRLRLTANEMPPGAAKNAALRKARQTDTAAHMDDWLTSPGLRAPQ
jgi:hypothetical protein